MLLIVAAAASRELFSTDDGDDGGVRPEQNVAEKERILRFWQLHREAGAHRISGDFGRAIRLYEEALSIDDRHEDALYYLANSYLEVGRLSDADRVLRRLVSMHPESSRGHSRLGEVHVCFSEGGLFDPRLAETSFRRALEVNQEETGPMLRLAQVSLIEGRLEDARRWLTAVIGSNATSMQPHFLLGYVLWKEGDSHVAKQSFSKASALARGELAEDRVVGEGDRKNGAAIRPGEQLTCPTLLDLLNDLTATAQAPGEMDASYAAVDRKLAALRSLGASNR